MGNLPATVDGSITQQLGCLRAVATLLMGSSSHCSLAARMSHRCAPGAQTGCRINTCNNSHHYSLSAGCLHGEWGGQTAAWLRALCCVPREGGLQGCSSPARSCAAGAGTWGQVQSMWRCMGGRSARLQLTSEKLCSGCRNLGAGESNVEVHKQEACKIVARQREVVQRVREPGDRCKQRGGAWAGGLPDCSSPARSCAADAGTRGQVQAA
eukprot:scaffold133661_cov19-Tisochrysis_lutea.AAC.1